MNIERKYFELESKSAGMGDEGAGWISGYANVKNIVDRVGDKVVDGAYQDLETTLKGWGSVSHDWSEGIGTLEEAVEDAHGLLVKVAFHSDEDSQKVRTRCKERFERGKPVFFSIGYETLDSAYETIDGQEVRILKAIKVYEVSIVMAPANEKSEALAMKSADGERSPLEAKLDAAVLAVADAAEHFKSHADMKGQTGRRVNPEKVAKAETLLKTFSDLIEGCREKQLDEQPDAALIHQIKMMEIQAQQSGLI
jgi:HK97 family phage prohead protease